MHTRNVLETGLQVHEKMQPKVVQKYRFQISRTHRVWPTCSLCGKDLEVRIEEAWGKQAAVAACPAA